MKTLKLQPLIMGALSLLFTGQTYAQNVCYGDTQLKTQEEVNNFGTKGCTAINGQLTLGKADGPSSIIDLSPLSSLRRIKQLHVSHIRTRSLEGLENLVKIEQLNIANSPQLRTLKGLSNISKINKIRIYNCGSLTSLRALWRIKNLEELQIMSNHRLKTLQGISDLDSVNELRVTDNTTLSDCCLLKGVQVTGSTYIHNNGPNCKSADEITLYCRDLRITGLSPDSGGAGTVVTVRGQFQRVQHLRFARAKASFKVLNDSTITATVPPGLPLGPLNLQVISSSEEAVLQNSFTLTEEVPLPTLAASNIKATTDKTGGTIIRWTRGNGLRRLVILKKTENPQDLQPQHGSIYPSSPSLQKVDSATDNYYVYNGKAGFIKLANLEPLTEYQVSIYEYNTDNKGSTRYLLAGHPAHTFTTGPSVECRGNFKLTDQNEVNAFGRKRCKSVKGSIVIRPYSTPSPIHDISPLSGLRDTDELTLYGTSITTLKGLDSLTQTDKLEITENEKLSSIAALSKLKKASSFEISGSDKLTVLHRLEDFDSADKIRICNNSSLTSIEALSKLRKVKELQICNNPKLASIAGLRSLREVEGILEIGDAGPLTSLTGLDNLIRAGQLEISTNIALTSLAALHNLREVKNLRIVGTAFLTSLSGLDNLAQAEQLEIGYNFALTSLTGLEKLKKVKNIGLVKNNILTSLTGLDGLMEIEGQFITRYNDALTSLKGLDNLKKVENLNLSDNAALTSLKNLKGLTETNELIIQNNDALTSLTGLGKLKKAKRISISGNAALISLKGLSSITETTKLDIGYNAALTSLAGLEKLKQAGTLKLRKNNSLTSLIGLDSLHRLDKVDIRYNEQLADCCLLKGVDIGGDIRISDNAPGCNSREDIEACSAPQPPQTRTVLSLSENPLYSTTTVHLDSPIKGAAGTAVLQIFNLQDRLIRIQAFKNGSVSLKRSDLPPGIYILKAYVHGQVATGKLVVR